jgi:hypothetical protein
MDRFIIKAKPQPYDVAPYTIVINNTSTINNTKYLTLIGRGFFNIKNIYFKNIKTSVLVEPLSLYNPFSAIPKLSANNPKFYGVKIENFNIVDNNHIFIHLPQIFLNSGYIDVVVENEAGLGFLTESSKISNVYDSSNIQDNIIEGVKVVFNNL